MYSNDAEAHS